MRKRFDLSHLLDGQARCGKRAEQLDAGSQDEYPMMSDGLGGFIHLNRAVEGWLLAGQNPFGLYLYREDVDGRAAAFAGEAIGQPGDKAWGMYEFALNGPDDTLVRIGWPTRLRPRTSN